MAVDHAVPGLSTRSSSTQCCCFTQTTFYNQLEAQHLHERHRREWGISRIPHLTNEPDDYAWCPHCAIDAILPETELPEIWNPDFMRAMNALWF
jgi:hypothetical protein